ncbi:MAG: GIY-YIG nuclease family protein [Candidatus Bathyarchaeota archaeon]|jgi:Uri superfamily endonuclease
MSLLKGIYVLIFLLNENIIVSIGALGEIFFERGLYAYIGSAQGGLKQRLNRHLRRTKQKFWHIDYLLDNDCVRILRVFHKNADKSEECKHAKKLASLGISINDFGSSDCNCESHLFRIKCRNTLNEFLYSSRFSFFENCTGR